MKKIKTGTLIHPSMKTSKTTNKQTSRKGPSKKISTVYCFLARLAICIKDVGERAFNNQLAQALSTVCVSI